MVLFYEMTNEDLWRKSKLVHMKSKYHIRNERTKDMREVEELTRKAFYI